MTNENKMPPKLVTAFFDRRLRMHIMKIKVDKDTDTLYFRLDENRIIESEEIRPGVILDYDENDQVVGVEFLNVSKRATIEELNLMQFQTV